MTISIQKGDIRAYLSAKLAARKKEISSTIDNLINGTIDPLLEKSIDLTAIVNKAHKLADEMEKLKDTHKMLGDHWYWTQRIRDVRGISGTKEDAIFEYKKKIRRAIQQKTDSYDFGTELNQAIAQLQTDCTPHYEALDALHTLEREAESIVKASSTGKKAFDTLQGLGIDFAEFDYNGKKVTALAPVTFSVDVSVLNQVAAGKEAQ